MAVPHTQPGHYTAGIDFRRCNPCLWLFPTPTRDAVVDSHVSTKEQQQMDIKALSCSCSSPSDDQICWRVLLTHPNSHIRLQTLIWQHGAAVRALKVQSAPPAAFSKINCYKPLLKQNEIFVAAMLIFPQYYSIRVSIRSGHSLILLSPNSYEMSTWAHFCSSIASSEMCFRPVCKPTATTLKTGTCHLPRSIKPAK